MAKRYFCDVCNEHINHGEGYHLRISGYTLGITTPTVTTPFREIKGRQVEHLCATCFQSIWAKIISFLPIDNSVNKDDTEPSLDVSGAAVIKPDHFNKNGQEDLDWLVKKDHKINNT